VKKNIVESRRRTKIVATLGPATDDPKVLEELICAGADVLRLNFSHTSPQDQKVHVDNVRAIALKLGRHVGIMGDLQGPKIRIEGFQQGSVNLKQGQMFVLNTDLGSSDGDETCVGVAYPQLIKDVSPGDVLLLDDGQIVLEVIEVVGSEIKCSVKEGGRLTDHKGLNKEGGGLSAPALTDKDKRDIIEAAKLDMDFLSVSFARNAADINEARKLLRDAGGQGHIVAKIERAEAVENIVEIIDASDVIMVARGDLAVEVGYAAMTGLQKSLIRETRVRNKISITATQMLESMITSASPTRAEVSDVANAVMDGTDAVMLSAETAIGEFPALAVKTMSELCVGAEKHETFHRPRNSRLEETFSYVDESIALAAMYAANHFPVTAIIAFTESGSTTQWMSRVRSDIPIFAFTRHETTLRRVSLYRGVYPTSFDIVHAEFGEVYQSAIKELEQSGFVRVGDRVLFTLGEMAGIEGGTNTLRILEVGAGKTDDAEHG
jgi:pyruvate kinase